MTTRPTLTMTAWGAKGEIKSLAEAGIRSFNVSRPTPGRLIVDIDLLDESTPVEITGLFRWPLTNTSELGVTYSQGERDITLFFGPFERNVTPNGGAAIVGHTIVVTVNSFLAR